MPDERIEIIIRTRPDGEVQTVLNVSAAVTPHRLTYLISVFEKKRISLYQRRLHKAYTKADLNPSINGK